MLDATPPAAPIVTLVEDGNNDGVIDANEADGPIDALVELPTDTQPGDILVVTDPEGNELFKMLPPSTPRHRAPQLLSSMKMRTTMASSAKVNSMAQ